MTSKYTTLDDIFRRCECEPNTGCWLWLGQITQAGYGMAWNHNERRKEGVHRIAFRFAGGIIPAGKELDHLCRQRSCCNPSHLRAVTRKENLTAPGSLAGRHKNANSKKTHCPRGHPYEGENLYVDAKGSRHCRKCQRMLQDKWIQEHREEYRAHWRAWRLAHKRSLHG